MSDIKLMDQWLKDLREVLLDQNLNEDVQLIKQLSLLEIKLEGLKVNLPGVSEEIEELLRNQHKASISEGVLDVLQSALGYYNLPDRKPGDNEPVLGPERAQMLKSELIKQTADVFSLKYQLAELLERDKNNENK